MDVNNMTQIKNKSWHRYLPYLYLHIAIPFFSARTAIMWRQYESDSIEYIALYIYIFKWQFEFRLYDTFKRI